MGSIKGVRRGPYAKSALRPNGKVYCWKCGKRYKRKPILIHHMKSVHMKQLVRCPVCGKSYVSVSCCNRHLKRIHNIFNSNHINLQNKPALPPVTSPEHLSFEPHSAFPWMSNALAIRESKKFGTHIRAERDIDVGETLMETPGFASINYISSVDGRCFECGKVSTLKCEHCLNLHFCSIRCSNCKIHRDMCDSIHSVNDCQKVRLVTKIMTIALKIANVEVLMDFCRGILLCGKNPKDLRPPYSAYAEILRLKGKTNSSSLYIANQAVKRIQSMSDFELPGTQDFKKLFINIALRHTASIDLNVFSDEIKLNHGVKIRYVLYDVLSRFNHSCASKVHHFFNDDDVLQCLAVRPIRKGEQVFINYLPEMKFDSMEERKKYIEDTWNFICSCEICSGQNTTQSNIRNNNSYQYVLKNFSDDSFQDRTKLMSECMQFLKEYGDVWSKEVELVQNCYIKLINTS